MDWVLALILMVGGYYILDLFFKHRERMSQISQGQTPIADEDDEDE